MREIENHQYPAATEQPDVDAANGFGQAASPLDLREAAAPTVCPQPAQVLDRIGDLIISLDRDWRFTYLNAASLQITGRPAAELLGRSLWDMYPALLGTELEHHYRRALREQVPVRFQTRGIVTGRWLDIQAFPSPDGLTVCTRDVTEHRRAETLREGEKRVLELIATARPLPEILDGLVRVIEEHSPGMLCSVLLLDAAGRLRHGAAPNLPDEYNRAVDGVAIGEGVGSCGTAAHRRERVVVADIATDPLWEGVRDYALRHGLRACWSTPICSARAEVLGTFAMYYREPRSPGPQELELIDRATHMAGIAIERARAEESLRASEAKYRALVETTDTGYAILDAAGRITDANAEYVRLTGHRTLEEIRGRCVAEWTAGYDRERNVAAVERCFAEGKVRHLELDYVGRDGKVTTIEANGTVVPTPDGAQIIGLCRDVTERRRAAEALRRSETRLRRIFESNMIGIIFWDVGGAVTEANDVFLKLVGYTREDLFRGRISWRDMTPPQYRHLDEHALREIARSGTCRPFEKEYLRKDGGRVPVLVGGASVESEPGQGVCFVLDIGSRRRDEQARERLFKEVRRSRKRLRALSRRLLEVQEEERRYLARELHDEIGQTLTGLKLSLEMALRESPGPLPPAVDHALAMATDLMERVRELSLRLRPTMLDDLGLRPALQWQIERYSAQTGIRVAFRHTGLDRRFPAQVETGVYRIVQEALTNVARHAGVPEVDVEVWADQQELVVRVRDQGGGFDLDRALAQKASTGLSGLYERARLLGGKLEIHSAPAAGTCLTATVPLDPWWPRRESP